MAGLLAAPLILAACGGGGQADRPADQILGDARTAARNAESVHITGNISQGTSKGTVDLLLTNRGDGKQEITAGDRTVSVIRVGETIHVKGIPGLGGPGYQKLSTKDPQAAQLVRAVDKNSLLDQLLGSKQKFIKAGSGKVGDWDVVKLEPQQGEGMLYIADDAENPYPLKLESRAPRGGLTITFARWNEAVTIKGPQAGAN
ncbi:MAG: hypothetical protein ACRDRZ_01720 [Pseudonocardiaceae bacterium]